jgi:hypothetical protein
VQASHLSRQDLTSYLKRGEGIKNQLEKEKKEEN